MQFWKDGRGTSHILEVQGSTLCNSGRTVEGLHIFWKIRAPLCYDETNEPHKMMDHEWNIKFWKPF
jgi:hypothetical protein